MTDLTDVTKNNNLFKEKPILTLHVVKLTRKVFEKTNKQHAIDQEELAQGENSMVSHNH